MNHPGRAITLLEPEDLPRIDDDSPEARRLTRCARALQIILIASALLIIAPLLLAIVESVIVRIPGQELAREIDFDRIASTLRFTAISWVSDALSILWCAVWWIAASPMRAAPREPTPRRIIRIAAPLVALGALSAPVSRVSFSVEMALDLRADGTARFWSEHAATLLEALGVVGQFAFYIAAVLFARAVARSLGDARLDRALARALWLLPLIDIIGPWLWQTVAPILRLPMGVGFFEFSTLFALAAIVIKFALLRRAVASLASPPREHLDPHAALLAPTITSDALRRVRAAAYIILAAIAARFTFGAILGVADARSDVSLAGEHRSAAMAIPFALALLGAVAWRRILDPRALAGVPARADRFASIARTALAACIVILAAIIIAGLATLLTDPDSMTAAQVRSAVEIPLLYAYALTLAGWWWFAAGRIALIAEARRNDLLARAAANAFWWAPGLWLASHGRGPVQSILTDNWTAIPLTAIESGVHPYRTDSTLFLTADIALATLPAILAGAITGGMVVRIATLREGDAP
jgi:hypothetical protein